MSDEEKSPAEKDKTVEFRNEMLDTVRHALSECDLLYCGRVWSAWSYGTMSSDDFTPAADIEEIVEAVADKIIEHLEVENARLKAENETLEKEGAAFESKVAKVEAVNFHLEAENARLKADVALLEGFVASIEGTMGELLKLFPINKEDIEKHRAALKPGGKS